MNYFVKDLLIFLCLYYETAAWLDKVVERRTGVREIEGSSPN